MKEKGQSSPLKILTVRLVWAIVYLVILLSLCISGLILFEKTNYILTYVEGQSMAPTLNNRLNNQYKDCGLVDENESIKNYLERFDVVITYYPLDYKPNTSVLITGASKKVKRLYGFPGETIEIGIDEDNTRYFKLNGEYIDLPFDVSLPQYKGADQYHKHCEYTLGDNEYFVVGDNWKNSSDSTHKDVVGPVGYEMISGILIKIVGYCTLDNEQNIKDIFYTEPRYFK